MDILGPDRGKMTIYGSDFQQVNLTPNGGVLLIMVIQVQICHIHQSNVLTDHLNILTYTKAWLLPKNKTTYNVLYCDLENSFLKTFSKL